MTSPRIKYAMAHLTRKQYTILLARPNWRRLRRRDDNTVLEPSAVSKAALKCHPSKRLKIMAQPKRITKKVDLTRIPTEYFRVHPKTLEANSTKRIIDLAIPKKTALLSTLKFMATDEVRTTFLKSLMKKREESRYQKYRLICNAMQQLSTARQKKYMRKLRRFLATPEDWNRHMQLLETLAAPRILRRSRTSIVKVRGKKWRPFSIDRVESLAMPMSRRLLKDLRNPFIVRPAALTYKISERMKAIAFKEPAEQMKIRMPGEVSEAAMKAIASPRMLELAKPSQRPEGVETDLKKDAFSVSPAALKAKCSRRLKNLAKPRVYASAGKRK